MGLEIGSLHSSSMLLQPQIVLQTKTAQHNIDHNQQRLLLVCLINHKYKELIMALDRRGSYHNSRDSRGNSPVKEFEGVVSNLLRGCPIL